VRRSSPAGDLELGGHPPAKDLSELGSPAAPQRTTWTEHMQATFETPQALR
jgi:hypothetical protein